MDMLYVHNDIFLTDITGYDRLNLVKFIPQNEVLGTPVTKTTARYSYNARRALTQSHRSAPHSLNVSN